jgi:hypothetical protein
MDEVGSKLRPHWPAIGACFLFWREISRTAFLEFCNTIEMRTDMAGIPFDVA